MEFERILGDLLMLLSTRDELVLQYLTAVKSNRTFVRLNGADVSQSDIFIYLKGKVITKKFRDCCSVYDLKEANSTTKLVSPSDKTKIIDISRNPRCC